MHLFEPVCAAEPINPLASSSPAKRISATASIIPDPQIPVTPTPDTFSKKSFSLDHCSQPITLKLGSLVIGSMRTRSIAPGAAL